MITRNTKSKKVNLMEQGEIILYQPDETIKLEVRMEDETVWLTQAQMAELFQTTRNNITLHIRNIFKENELVENSVCKESLRTAADGKKYRTNFYNLDVIISVGYRVKSIRGTQFRQWANKVLKEYLLKRYSINNVFKEKELEEKSNVQFLHIANSDSAVKDSLTAQDGRISIKINIF